MTNKHNSPLETNIPLNTSKELNMPNALAVYDEPQKGGVKDTFNTFYDDKPIDNDLYDSLIQQNHTNYEAKYNKSKRSGTSNRTKKNKTTHKPTTTNKPTKKKLQNKQNKQNKKKTKRLIKLNKARNTRKARKPNNT